MRIFGSFIILFFAIVEYDNGQCSTNDRTNIMRTLIINNLSSGLQDGAVYDFMRKLNGDGDELVVRSTNGSANGSTAIESLLSDATSFDRVVAAGGDATISAVGYALRNSGVPLLPFPAGTGNLIVTNLDQPEEPVALAKLVRENTTVDYDLGELSFETEEGKQTRGFAVMAGAGYDARIMEDSEKLKGLLGPMAYLASAITNPLPTVAHFTITLDDKVLEIDGIAVLVINFAKIFPDVAITHGNDARDGLFEVAVIKSHSAIELLPAVFGAFLDRDGLFPGRADALEVCLSKTVRVESDPPLAIQFDGEPTGACTPFEARLLPQACRFVVTEKEHERCS
ncbi:MAG: diacylglycerol kinase [Coriobacteriia bacterium]|nr:diacylglycerol kinase [Coriobacteriia bacterium]